MTCAATGKPLSADRVRWEHIQRVYEPVRQERCPKPARR